MEKKKTIMTKFVFGETSFVSSGFSRLKITDDGKSEIVNVPIKSIGIQEAQDALLRDAPKPPAIMKTIKANSGAGRRLGLEDDEVRQILDFSDPAYLKSLEAFREKSTWALIIPGLNLDFFDKDGNKITDYDEIRKGLINAGITGPHLDQLAADINQLTANMEKSADFLSGNGSGSPAPLSGN